MQGCWFVYCRAVKWGKETMIWFFMSGTLAVERHMFAIEKLPHGKSVPETGTCVDMHTMQESSILLYVGVFDPCCGAAFFWSHIPYGVWVVKHQSWTGIVSCCLPIIVWLLSWFRVVAVHPLPHPPQSIPQSLIT